MSRYSRRSILELAIVIVLVAVVVICAVLVLVGPQVSQPTMIPGLPVSGTLTPPSAGVSTP
jgi:hypothetical protein